MSFLSYFRTLQQRIYIKSVLRDGFTVDSPVNINKDEENPKSMLLAWTLKALTPAIWSQILKTHLLLPELILVVKAESFWNRSSCSSLMKWQKCKRSEQDPWRAIYNRQSDGRWDITLIAACTENSWFQAYVCHCGDWRGSKRLLKLSSRVSFQSPWRTSLCVCWGGLSLCFEINFTCEFRVEKTLKNQQLLLCLAQDDRVHVKPPP